MAVRRSTRKPAQSAVQTHPRRAGRGAGTSASPPTKRNSQSLEAVRDYIAEMASVLAQLALANRLDSLAVACDVVREIAQGNVKAEGRLLKPS